MSRIAPIALVLLIGLSAAASDEGAALYRQKACATCHGADGRGQTPAGKAMKARDLGSAEVQKQSDDELAAVIAGGKGKMPGYASTLTAEQIRQVVAFIRTLKHD